MSTELDLLSSDDAMFWAESFIEIRERVLLERGEDIAEDPGTMVGWFANAMQVGEWSSQRRAREILRENNSL